MAGMEIRTPHLCCFIARRNSGKSHLQRYLLHCLAGASKFSHVRVITSTKFNGEWSAIVGDENVYETFNEDDIERLLDHQKACKLASKPNPILLILDDMLGSMHMQSPIMLRLASTGRHFEVSLWLTAQHYAKCPTWVRSNADHLFILNPQNDRVIRNIHDEFSPEGYDDWRDWKKFVLAACRDFGVVAIGPDRIAHVIRAPAQLPQFQLQTSKTKRHSKVQLKE